MSGKEQTQGLPVEDPAVVEETAPDDWTYPFPESAVKAWKAQYGELSVQEDDNGKVYVIRGIGRKEYLTLEAGSYRNMQDYENQFASTALVYPDMTEMQIRSADAGLAKTIYDRIAPLSGAGSSKDVNVVSFDPKLHGEKLKGTTAADWNAWIAAARGRKLFFCELERKPFVFRNLSRSQYENYRIQVEKDGEVIQENAESVATKEAVVYPMPSDFDPEGNAFLYGTIQSLAVLIMRESGFGKAMRITKL